MTTNRLAAKSLVALAALAAIGGGASVAMIASAQTSTTTATATTQPAAKSAWMGMRGPGGMHRKEHGVMGTVSAVNGNTVTVTNKDGTSYTVDASTAKVSKVVELSVGDIKVGDTVGVQGTVSGTSVKALHIMDGVPPTPQAPPSTNTQ